MQVNVLSEAMILGCLDTCIWTRSREAQDRQLPSKRCLKIFAHFSNSRCLVHGLYVHTVTTLYMYPRTTMTPPRVLISEPNPAGAIIDFPSSVAKLV